MLPSLIPPTKNTTKLISSILTPLSQQHFISFSSPSSSSSSSTPPNLYHHYSSLLQTLISTKSLSPAKQLHARLILTGLSSDPHLSSKLLNLYSLTHLPSAHQLFDQIPQPNTNLFLWNVLIRAYAWRRPHHLAISLYHLLVSHRLLPDNFTFPFVLKACSALSDVDTDRTVHEMAVRTRWDRDVFVAAGLIDMYAKCGCVADARDVFNRVSDRDAVLWNS